MKEARDAGPVFGNWNANGPCGSSSSQTETRSSRRLTGEARSAFQTGHARACALVLAKK